MFVLRAVALLVALASCDKILALGTKIRCTFEGTYAVEEWTSGMPWQCEPRPGFLGAWDLIDEAKRNGEICIRPEMVEITKRCSHPRVSPR